MRPERKEVSQGDVVTQKSRTKTVPRRKGSAMWNAVERSKVSTRFGQIEFYQVLSRSRFCRLVGLESILYWSWNIRAVRKWE